MNAENSKQIVDRDINELFDDILLTEEIQEEEGYKEGFKDGQTSGNTEGYHLGYHRGAELGAELGYYLGIANFHLPTTTSDKILKNLTNLKSLINCFPTTNSPEVDLFVAAENIRAQFKKVCALLKIDGKFPGADKLTF